jgi:hypothetical protein
MQEYIHNSIFLFRFCRHVSRSLVFRKVILKKYFKEFEQIYHAWEGYFRKISVENGEGNLVSRLVFFSNTPPKIDLSV